MKKMCIFPLVLLRIKDSKPIHMNKYLNNSCSIIIFKKIQLQIANLKIK